MRVLLAGEGATELGSWDKEPAYRPRSGEATEPGVLEALLRRVDSNTPFEIVDGFRWRSIPLYQAGEHRHAETRRVLRLAQRAEERGCVLVFTRDRDRDRQREIDITAGVLEAQQKFSAAIVGGVAIEEIESWILALLGETKTERLPDPKRRLQETHGIQGTREMVDIIARADLGRVPNDASSLRAWLDAATVVLVMTS